MHGNYLFVGITSPAPSPIGSITEIRVWNLTDPSAPELETVMPFQELTTLSTKDNRLIVAQRNQGFSMFDITDPIAPILLTRVPVPGGALRTASDDNWVFAVTEESALISVRVDDCVEWEETRSF